MEKKINGSFNAVSIISLITAIIYSIFTVILLVVSILDFDNFVVSLIDTVEVTPTLIEDAKAIAIGFFATNFISMIASQVLLYLAFVKFKKYSCLTDEEAVFFKGRIVAWVIVMFLFAGLVIGVVALVGYNTTTKQQIENYTMQQYQQRYQEMEQSQAKTEQKTEEQTDFDMDKMIARLEKLNRIKEMGGLTDEEYERLRKEIVNKK